MFRVPEKYRITTGAMGSTSIAGNNGAFLIRHYEKRFYCIASDGTEADREGLECLWEHVSISIPNRPDRLPDWAEMCFIKSVFWGEEDVVVQFHPAKSQYVNFANVLHLWALRPGIEMTMPIPPSYLVGPKEGQTAMDCHRELEATRKEKVDAAK